jgi:uncharacterized membrane protein YraQ (UPF0718 family)
MPKKNKSRRRISNGVKFLIAVVCLYLLIALLNFDLIKTALVGTLLIFVKIIPILIIVFIAMLVINSYVAGDRLKKYLGPDSGAMGWLYATIFGILISGPPYILYPLLGDLKAAGMKDSLLAVFLYNRNVKIPFIPVMIFYFGLAFTMIISIYIIIFSIFNGIAVNYFTNRKQ